MSQPRIAIVTGSAVGIGHAIALRLADDGCNLILNDLPSQSEQLNAVVKEIEAKGRKAVTYIGDISVEKNVQELVDMAVTSFGGLDIMVANAGIGLLGSIMDTSMEDFNKVLSVNLGSVFLSYKYAAAQMIKQGRGGRIIGASSVWGKTARASTGAYSASKFAIRGLTQSAAQEWGQYGITVNAYCPGLIWTPMIQNGHDFMKSTKFYGSSGDMRDVWAEVSAVKRHGLPEDIANLVSFFASEKSSFVTGQSILADGGTLFD